MSYVGGKSKNSQFIIDILNNPFFDNKVYLEPFVGYGHITKRIQNKKKYYLGDNNEDLIILLKYIQKCKGKYPSITPKQYEILKKTKQASIEKSIAGFCYSYNGKQWGGYVNRHPEGDKIRNYPAERKRHYELLRKTPSFQQATIRVAPYDSWKPKGYVIYCDPPYINTTGYTSSSDFNHTAFWNTIRRWSIDNYVFVSEYTAPSDFKEIGSSVKYSSLSGKGAGDVRTERLFIKKTLWNTLRHKLC